MKASVSHHTISTFGLIGSLLILWAVLVIPGAPCAEPSRTPTGNSPFPTE